MPAVVGYVRNVDGGDHSSVGWLGRDVVVAVLSAVQAKGWPIFAPVMLSSIRDLDYDLRDPSGARTADLDAGTHHGEFTRKTVDLCADEADGEVPQFRRLSPTQPHPYGR